MNYIKRLKRWVLSLSFRTKLLVTIFLINVLIVILSATIFLFSANEQMHNFNHDITAQGVKYLGANLDELSIHMKEISETLVLDPTLLNSATPSADENDFEVQLQNRSYLQKLMGNYYYNNIPIYSTVYYEDEPIYIKYNYMFACLEQLKETGITLDELTTTDIYWTGLFESSVPGFDSDDRYIGGVRSLINYENFGHLGGAVSVYISESDIRKLLNSLSSSTNSTVILTDSEERIISSTEPQDISMNFADVYGKSTDEIEDLERISLNDEEMYYVSKYIVENTGWVLVAGTPIGNIIGNNDLSIEGILIFIGCLLAIIIFVDIIVSRSLNNRVRNIFDRIASSDMRTEEDEAYLEFKDELKKVLIVHKTLHDKNATLAERILQEELAHKNATLSLLHAQIDSHFLYNSLDSINWMAKKHKAEDIVDMVQLLSKFYRLTLSKGREVISVTQELEHTATYLKLQEIRYESQLSFEVKACEGLENRNIVKLTLQPLVENAIIHGIMEKEEPCGKITIATQMCDNTLRITISDDGVGMPKDIVDAINNDEALPVIKSRVNNGSNFGIRNIKERLKIHYKNNASIVMHSSEEGTVVELIIGYTE